MKLNETVIVKKQKGIIRGLAGDLYYNTNLNKNIKVPLSMVCVEINNTLLIYHISQIKIF
jgi:hypothetical protein